ncbi:MAG: hypothetical protein IPK26_19025 [Planctomycetes bacterium]|nr:hypothetical protein [Planctomycetota bacterium]
MGTATHQPPHAPHGHAGHGAAEPPPHDWENEINAKATTIWVVGWGVIFFAALYFMLPLFDRVLHQEIQKKVNNLAPTERQDLEAAEKTFLSGQEGRTSKKSIEQVMQEMTRK